MASGFVAAPAGATSSSALRGQASRYAEVDRAAALSYEAWQKPFVADTTSPAGGEASWLERWGRSMVVALSVVAALGSTLTVSPKAARAAEGSSSPAVSMYFGQGCFWHVQHDFVVRENKKLGRDTADVITSVAGYAGGTKVGDKSRVCYHNMAGAPDYGKMGHTEVVNVTIPEDKVSAFARDFFDDANGYPFGRRDPQDRGGEYRSAIGIPGGMDGPLFEKLKEANNGRLQLVKGVGNDADTVGSKKVWVYDSDQFPFYQGEIYHQFHNDMTEFYNDAYHKLKDEQLKVGQLKKVECPELGF